MLYISAGIIIEKAQNKQGSIKSLVYSSGLKNIKELYALVCQTLQYSSVLEQVMAAAGLLQQEKWLKEPVARCMTYDLLFGKGVKCRGKFKRAMKRHTSSLEGALANLKKAAKVTRNEDLLPRSVREKVAMPRYVRVNRLKTTVKEVEESFIADGYECVLSREEADEQMNATDPTINSTQCVHHIKNLQPKQFMADLDLGDVFVFAPETDLHDHKLFKGGQVLLQDKASCIPATVLDPPPGSHVIDSCAAPGNKTSHLASIMGNTGKIFAFERSKGRYHTLCRLVPKAGVTNTTFHRQDFLETDPDDEELTSAEYILVDPSCSGTGMVGRQDDLTNNGEEPSQERLELLSQVQLKLLNHALSFPQVKRVVYSTCSIHAEENEQVVMNALEENPNFELKRVLPPWGQNAGLMRNFSGGDGEDGKISHINSVCLHAVPDEHRTNGFFVALFEKKSVGKKRQLEDEEEEEEEKEEIHQERKKKHKKKKHISVEEDDETADTPQNVSHDEDQEDTEPMNTEDIVKSHQKKKKKKSHHAREDVEEDIDTKGQVEGSSELDRTVTPTTTTPSKAKHSKKKKKKNRQSLVESS